MVRIRAKPVKAVDLLQSTKPPRKRKFGERQQQTSSSANDQAIGLLSGGGGGGGNNVSLRASKRVRTTHLPYQSPESVDALITVAGTRRSRNPVAAAIIIQETPKRKSAAGNPKRAPKKLEKPVKRLQKQVSSKKLVVQPNNNKVSVRRKLLSTPEPASQKRKASSASKVKAKVTAAQKAVTKSKLGKVTKVGRVVVATKKSADDGGRAGKKRKATKDQPAAVDEDDVMADVAPPTKKRGKGGAAADQTQKGKRRKGKLNPKPDLTNYDKNPTYESRLEIPFISTLAQSRLIIRAVVLNDMKLLKKLIFDDPKKINSTCMKRSYVVEEDALDIIFKTENREAFKLLTTIPDKVREKFGSAPSLLLSKEHTGRGSTMMFGHALRQVSVGRGGKEGNDAFLYDRDLYLCGGTRQIDSMKPALTMGVSEGFLKFMMEQRETTFWEFTNVHHPLRRGHHELAAACIAEANKRGGYGFNFLHHEALAKKSAASLTPFKPVSVVKKCTYEPRFSPLHCAAVNPNVEVLTALLRSMPDYNLADGGGWSVGHYAAVCSGPEPLKYLLQFGVSIHAVTSTKRGGDGYTLLHAAVAAGRTHNVKTILAHDKATKEASNGPDEADGDEEEEGNQPRKMKSLAQNDILLKLTTGGKNVCHMACELGHVDILKLLLAAEVDADRPTPAKNEKLTPLMIACQYGHLGMVKILVEDAGVKLEAKDKRGRTAAAHATMNGQTHVLSYLLRLGVNHLAVDSSGNSLLHYAAAYGWYFETMLLLEAGCPPNACNTWKMTPVAIAFMKGHTGLVEILLKQEGVDVNARIDDDSGRSLLLETCSRDSDLEKVKFLVDTLKADPKAEDFNGNNALHYFASRSLNENTWDFKEKITPFNNCVAYLVQVGCDPTKKNSEGKSSILLAAESSNFHFISKVLQLKIKIPFEKDDKDENTLLHHLVTYYASETGHSVLSKIVADTATLPILKEMASTYNKAGFTPFLLMLSKYRTVIGDNRAKLVKMTEWFLGKLEVPVNAVVEDKSKLNALHLTVGLDYASEILPILLKHKPELDALDKQGETPLVKAVLQGLHPVAEKLIAAGANVNFKVEKENGIGLVLLSAMREGSSFYLLPKLISKGADVREVHPKTKNTILHYIARKPTLPHALDSLNSVLAAGVSPNLKNCDGRTPLHLVVNARGRETDVFYDIEDALIGAGANLAIKDHRGRIPLHYAFVKVGAPTDKTFFDPIELVSSIVTAMKSGGGAGSELHSTDVFGSSPLHYSAFRGATICSSYLAQAIPRAGIDLCDNNGNTPFGLAVRNCHEGCALNFYQNDADYLRTINNNIKTLEAMTEEGQVGKSLKAAPREPWQWDFIVSEKREQDKLFEEQQKYPIFEQVVMHNWQGLLYLMIGRLESSGVGFSTGIATALKTNRFKLALKLAYRVKSKRELTLESGTLFHNLAKKFSGSEVELVTKIVESFRKHGLDPSATDEFGSQAILYSLMNQQTQLGDILFHNNRDPMKLFASMRPDLFGRTPFSALFWDLKLETPLNYRVEAWANQLVAAGADPNHPCEYPIILSSYPGVRLSCKLTDVIPSSNAVRYTPLIIAVITKCYKTVKWLLNLKSGPHPVDINARDSEGRTALMHAVRLNNVHMVKVLLDPISYDYLKDPEGSKSIQIKSTSINLSILDKSGWSVMDYMIRSTGSYWQYKNIQQIFKVLTQVGGGVALNVSSGDGLKPLDRAIKERRSDVVEMLGKALTSQKQKPMIPQTYSEFAPSYSQDIVLTPILDYSTTAEKMAEKILEKERDRLRKEGKSEEIKVKPDSLCGFDEDNAEVMTDDKQNNIPYDVVMTKVDLSYGIHGLYNFYKMQLVKQPKGKELIILFTQWGRVGDTGQFQKTPFASEDEAIKEFCKIFRAKSGNGWEDVSNFNPLPNKYRLVKKDLRIVKRVTHTNVDFPELEKYGRETGSSLPGNVLHLMKVLCGVHQDAKSTYGSGGYYRSRYSAEPDYSNIPLVPMEVLSQAEAILKEIQGLIETEEKMKSDTKGQFTEADRLEVINKIVFRSEDFFTVFPVYGYEAQKLEPIFSYNDLRPKLEEVNRLSHLELGKTLLLAAQLSQQTTNPYEYVYRCLGAKAHFLDRSNSTEREEAEILLQYIHNTAEDSTKVHGIWRVSRPEEEFKLSATKVHNRQLLWHGTSAANLLSILHQGLQVAPLGAAISGHMFGKGIYLADMFAKSQKYCRTISVGGKQRKFMLLCEAALGKIYEVKLEDAGDKPMPSGFDSLKTADSQYEPNPECTVLWKGRTVALGKKAKKPKKEKKGEDDDDDYYYGLDYNEYIIFNKEQVAMRYLIEFED